MNSISFYFVILFFSVVFIYPSAFSENAMRPDADVSKIQRKRDAALDAIIKPISEIRIKYLEELEARREEAQAEGDLDGVIAADEVIEDQAVETSFDPIYEDDKIEQIQKKYGRWYDEAMIKAEGQELQINRTYVQDLDAVIKNLTKAGFFEHAKQVRDIKETFIAEYKESRRFASSLKKKNFFAERINQRTSSLNKNADKKTEKIVVIDRLRGAPDNYDHLVSSFTKSGWTVRMINGAVDFASVEDAVLYVVYEGNTGNSVYADSELDLLERQFRRGKLSIITVGATWYWKLFKNQNELEIPASQLGERLGFKVPLEWTEAMNVKPQVVTSDYLSNLHLKGSELCECSSNLVTPGGSDKEFYSGIMSTKEGDVAALIRNSKRLDTSVCVVFGCGSYVHNGDIFGETIKYIQKIMKL